MRYPEAFRGDTERCQRGVGDPLDDAGSMEGYGCAAGGDRIAVDSPAGENRRRHIGFGRVTGPTNAAPIGRPCDFIACQDVAAERSSASVYASVTSRRVNFCVDRPCRVTVLTWKVARHERSMNSSIQATS